MDFSSSIVSKAFFIVAGCGALGNEVLKCLALMGVGRLLIVDFDKVESSNLDRSVLFRRCDVGRFKVDAARDGILRLNPGVQVDVINGDIAHDVGLALVRSADAVIGCVDSRWARYCINRLAFRAGKSWVDGGIHSLTGTARVFRPGVNCYACSLSLDELNDLRRRMPCSGVIRRQIDSGHAPTTAIVASVIGAIEAQEAIKLLHCDMMSLAGRMAIYEGEEMNMNTVSFVAYDDDCPCHEEWSPVVKTDITIDMSVSDALAVVDAFDLRDDCFVDYIISRIDNVRNEVMLPGRHVAEHVETHPSLGLYTLSQYYQNEYHVIDASFPYKNLKLSQLGITAYDILRGFINVQDIYFELK